MIIQCRKCETRFRFDETLIEGDGVWVRCSRCQHVFFQERPAAEKQALSTVAGSEIPSVRISDARRIPDDRFPEAEERSPVREKEKAVFPPSSFADAGKESYPEIEREPVIERSETGLETGIPDRSLDRDDGKVAWEEEEELPGAEREGGRWGRTILKLALLMIFTVLIASMVCLWLFPDVRTQALEWVSPWLRSVPVVEKFFAAEVKSDEAVPAPVLIKDIRQRSVTNLLAGNLRVIEGTAVNQAPYPLGRIRVRLVISDAYDVVLGEKVVYCGNLMTDAELGALAEAEIQRELSTPQGTDVSNERIPPNGEISFMIVFSQEQAGAIKTAVAPAGADRVP
jgi:predicted Zn finger-like uncharacterized protein